MINKENVYKNL